MAKGTGKGRPASLASANLSNLRRLSCVYKVISGPDDGGGKQL